LDSIVRISTLHKKSMTLPKNGKKLTEMEEISMKIALKEADIRAIHPERMEALAHYLVEKAKSQNK
jgi:hypothetical protein